MSRNDGPEAAVVVRLFELEQQAGDDGPHSEKGILVHEELRIFRIIDERAQDLIVKFDDHSRPHGAQLRFHNALRSLKSKQLVWRERVGTGTYRYFLTQVGRGKAARLSYALTGV